jgi:competence protein ComEC
VLTRWLRTVTGPGAGGPDGRRLALPTLGDLRLWLQGAAAMLAAERPRWILWTPVAAGTGIWLYFALPLEPPRLLAFGLPGLAAAGLLAAWRRGRGQPAALALLMIMVGFAAGAVRTALVDTPLLRGEMGPVWVEGRVVAVDQVETALRLLLAEPQIERLTPAETPRSVRVRLHRGDTAPPPAGARVRVLAVLNTPPEPAAPGSFDFRRNAYFQGIGGVGFALRRFDRLPDNRGGPTWSDEAERLREAIARRVAARLSGPRGAVTTALLNGEQTGIPDATMTAFRASGLAHLLSISGLHVALIAGLVFFLVRALLALWEGVALRFPIKKWAAGVALLATVGYMLLVGASVPTQRSVVMTGIVLLAVIVDRNALTLRLVALAALGIMLVQPESLLGPSFQMSFSAVTVLIVLFEGLQPHLQAAGSGAGSVRRGLLYLLGSVITSIAATAATAPFALYHFQQFTPYGVLANALAVPITSFWVMPAALVVYALMPLGWDGWAIDAMGWGVAAVLWVADRVAALPGALMWLPAMPPVGLGLVVAGGLWLCLWQQSWRWWGLGALALGFATVPLAARPDLLVSADGDLVAVRDGDGALTVSSGRRNKFEAEVWQHRDGTDAKPAVWRAGSRPGGWLDCTAALCRYRPPGLEIAIVREADGLAEGCAGGALVVNLVPGAECPAIRVIDRTALAARGAHAVYLHGATPEIETARPGPRARPWN